MKKGALYVVATPIGNLEDITVRAIEVLRKVDLIACEDTRRTRILLRRWDISARLMSLHRFSEARKTSLVLERLERGLAVALVSDAGTPALSDPGSRLVRSVMDASIQVVPVPGPSSLTAALSASGAESSSFLYAGFVPRKPEARRRFFEAVASGGRTVVFFETARRIEATLAVAAETLGPTRLVLMRELTKIHEEIIAGTAERILAELQGRTAVKGEIVVVVDCGGAPESSVDLNGAVKTLMEEGLTGKHLASEACSRFGVKKGEAYRKFLELKEETEAPK